MEEPGRERGSGNHRPEGRQRQQTGWLMTFKNQHDQPRRQKPGRELVTLCAQSGWCCECLFPRCPATRLFTDPCRHFCSPVGPQLHRGCKRQRCFQGVHGLCVWRRPITVHFFCFPSFVHGVIRTKGPWVWGETMVSFPVFFSSPQRVCSRPESLPGATEPLKGGPSATRGAAGGRKRRVSEPRGADKAAPFSTTTRQRCADVPELLG